MSQEDGKKLFLNNIRKNLKKYILGLGLIIGCIVLVRMVWHGYFFEETNNAYVHGNVSIVSTRVPEIITDVLVLDNQKVRKGDVLAILDSTDQNIKIEQIRAEIALVDVQYQQIGAEIIAQKAEADALKSQVERFIAEKKRTESEVFRSNALYKENKKAISTNEINLAIAANDIAIADLQAAIQREQAAREKVVAQEYLKKAQLEQKNVLLSRLKEAEVQLGYHKIISPVDGYIGKKNIEIGNRVQPGQQLFAIVQQERWVIANFKETQLDGLKKGQEVTIRIDAIPNKKYIGIIDSFSPASGAQFSLLPPDNATGNFTKIVQRIPIKITFVSKDIEKIFLGMSATVEIDKRQ